MNLKLLLVLVRIINKYIHTQIKVCIFKYRVRFFRLFLEQYSSQQMQSPHGKAEEKVTITTTIIIIIGRRDIIKRVMVMDTAKLKVVAQDLVFNLVTWTMDGVNKKVGQPQKDGAIRRVGKHRKLKVGDKHST